MTSCMPVSCERTETQAPSLRGRVNITEFETEFRVDADVPGAGKDDVEIQIENGTLSFTATIPEPEASDRKERLREFRGRRITREFRIGDTIDPEGITAHVERGVLTIHLRKTERAHPRRIEIQ